MLQSEFSVVNEIDMSREWKESFDIMLHFRYIVLHIKFLNWSENDPMRIIGYVIV